MCFNHLCITGKMPSFRNSFCGQNSRMRKLQRSTAWVQPIPFLVARKLVSMLMWVSVIELCWIRSFVDVKASFNSLESEGGLHWFSVCCMGFSNPQRTLWIIYLRWRYDRRSLPYLQSYSSGEQFWSYQLFAAVVPTINWGVVIWLRKLDIIPIIC